MSVLFFFLLNTSLFASFSFSVPPPTIPSLDGPRSRFWLWRFGCA